MNQHQTTLAGPPRPKGVLNVVTTDEATLRGWAWRVSSMRRRRRRRGCSLGCRAHRRPRADETGPETMQEGSRRTP